MPNISATTKNEPAGTNKPLHNAIPAIIRSIDLTILIRKCQFVFDSFTCILLYLSYSKKT